MALQALVVYIVMLSMDYVHVVARARACDKSQTHDVYREIVAQSGILCGILELLYENCQNCKVALIRMNVSKNVQDNKQPIRGMGS